MNKALFEKKLQSLKNSDNYKNEIIECLYCYIQDSEELSLIRINPYTFAEEFHFPLRDIVDLFVHAARLGIFDLTWNFICPNCGGVLYSHDSINKIHGENYFCNICEIKIMLNIDDYVEVSFNVNPEIRKISQDFLADFQTYRAAHFSKNVVASAQLAEYMKNNVILFVTLRKHQSTELQFTASSEKLYRLLSVNIHASVYLVSQKILNNDEQYIQIDVRNSFQPQKIEIASNRVNIKLISHSEQDIGVTLVSTDFKLLHQILSKTPNTIKPFLTGKHLLNNSKFRKLYNIQNLSTNLKLNIRSLTILFTDLKGSTQLYDSMGDVDAYDLIQKHFKILSKIVDSHFGVIIKTMGDAIMATFSEPLDGIKAADDMLEQILQFNEGENNSLELKVGIHEGHALAISNDGKLDYFGQTVNIAARIQGLATGNELWISEQIMRENDIQEYVSNKKWSIEKFSVSLKGIGKNTVVYRCIRGNNKIH